MNNRHVISMIHVLVLLALAPLCSRAQQIGLRQIQSNVNPPPQYAIPWVYSANGNMWSFDSARFNWDPVNNRVNLQNALFLSLIGGSSNCLQTSTLGIVSGSGQLCPTLPVAFSNLTISQGNIAGLWVGTGCGTGTNSLLVNGNCGTGGGGGTSFGYFATTLTSTTVYTIGTDCSSGAPCNGQLGDTASQAQVSRVTTTATATISAGSALWFAYLDSGGNLDVGTNGVGTVTCSNCTTTVLSTAAFPPGSVPLYTFSSSSGLWVSNGLTDYRAPIGNKPNTTVGTGLTQSGNQVSADTTVLAAVNGATVTNMTCSSGCSGFGGSSTPFAARNTVDSVEEFLPGQFYGIGTFGWQTASVAGSGSAGFVTSFTGHPGVVEVFTSSATNDTQVMNLESANTGGISWLNLGTTAGYTGWEVEFTIETNASIASTALVFGFMDSNTYRSGNSIAIRYDAASVSCTTGTNSTSNWMIETFASGSSTCSDLGVAVSTSQWYTFDITSTSLGTVIAKVSVNGGTFSSPVTVATHVPTAAMYPQFLVKTETTSIARLWVDYWELLLQGLTR